MDRFSVDDGNSRISFSEWQALGYDSHSMLSSPDQLFLNPDLDDYRLGEGSPAIDRGVALDEVTDDLLGVHRPSGTAYDVGAYEFTDGTQPPPLSNRVYLPGVFIQLDRKLILTGFFLEGRTH